MRQRTGIYSIYTYSCVQEAAAAAGCSAEALTEHSGGQGADVIAR